jgi:hypothetical protein
MPCPAIAFNPDSALTLLVSGVRADHPHDPAAADDLAVPADLLDRCTHFHGCFSVIEDGPVT